MNTLQYLQCILSLKCWIYIQNFSVTWRQLITDVTCSPNRWCTDTFLLCPIKEINQPITNPGHFPIKSLPGKSAGDIAPRQELFFHVSPVWPLKLPLSSFQFTLGYVLKQRNHKCIWKIKLRAFRCGWWLCRHNWKMVKRMSEVPEVEHPDSWVVFEIFGPSGLVAPSTTNMNLVGRCSTGLTGLMYTFMNNSKSSSQWITPKAVFNLSKSYKWLTKLPSVPNDEILKFRW